jgi:uncharacterized protein (DUF4213/DUF364 family)
MSRFLIQTKEILKEKLEGKKLPDVKSVLIGRKYLAVLLDTNLGVCYGPRKTSPTCTIFKDPGNIRKKHVLDLLEFVGSDSLIERGIGIATTNALTQFYLHQNPENYNFYTDKDILKLLPLKKDITVGMVGRIGPFIKFLANHSAHLTIIDDNPAFSEGKIQEGVEITRDIKKLKDVEILLLTGSSIVEHSIEKPLQIAQKARFKSIIGPTASWIPNISFDLGADVIGGMQFFDPEAAFRTIMEGGGTRYFSKFADKYLLTKEPISNSN